MALQMRTERGLRTVWLPEQAVGPNGLVGKGLLWILPLMILTGGALLACWPGPATAPSAALQQAVAQSLTEGRPNTPERLVQAASGLAGAASAVMPRLAQAGWQPAHHRERGQIIGAHPRPVEPHHPVGRQGGVQQRHGARLR